MENLGERIRRRTRLCPCCYANDRVDGERGRAPAAHECRLKVSRNSSRVSVCLWNAASIISDDVGGEFGALGLAVEEEKFCCLRLGERVRTSR